MAVLAMMLFMALTNNYGDFGIVKSATPLYERANFWITRCEFGGAAFVVDLPGPENQRASAVEKKCFRMCFRNSK